MPAASNGVVKINETMQGSALSSWDERLSRSTKSNYNFLTVSKDPLGRLVLAAKFGEDACVGRMLFSLLAVPAVSCLCWAWQLCSNPAALGLPSDFIAKEVRALQSTAPSSTLTARSRATHFGQASDGDIWILGHLGAVPSLRGRNVV